MWLCCKVFVRISAIEHAVIAEISLCNYTKGLFSAVHWSILTTDTESLSPCGRVGSTIFVSTISSNHWFLRAKLQICHSCCHPPLKSLPSLLLRLGNPLKDPLGVANEPCCYPKCKKKPTAIEVNHSLNSASHLFFFVLCFTLLYFWV